MTEDARPEPMTPADCDLQDFEFMPVMVRRLLKSDTWSLGTGDERAAAVALWFESWHQVPAASLPGDDRLLKRLADSDKWAKVKEQALRGWVLCSDGRLYHPVVAEKALESWIEKLLAGIAGASGNAKRWGLSINTEAGMAQLQAAIHMLRALAPQSRTLKKKSVVAAAAGIAPGSPPDPKAPSPPDSGADRNRQGQGQRQGQGTGDSAPTGAGGEPPPPPRALPKRERTEAEEADARLWRELKVMFVDRDAAKDAKAAGVLLGGLATKYGKDVFRDAANATLLAKPIEPHTYLVGLCEAAAGKRQPVNRQEAQEQRNRSVAERWAAEGENHEAV